MPVLPVLQLLLALAVVQDEPYRIPIPPLPDISPLAPPGWSDPVAPRLPPCPPPPAAPAVPGLTIAGIAFAPADIASAVQGWDGQTGQPLVNLDFAESGHRKFLGLQRNDCEGQVLEIRVDGELLSDPVLLEPIHGTNIQIAGSFSEEEAAALAARLNPPRAPD